MPINKKNIPLLTTFYMYLTGGCNLACRHCWISPSFEQDGKSGECLDFDLYKLAIKEGLPLGLHGIKYTGGEPLLHPDFVNMAEYAEKKGLKTWLETNGTLITKDIAKDLKKKSSIYHISVSIDGAKPSTHDYFRNVQGSFDSAMQGISFLADAGFKPQIIMSLFPDNISEIESLVDIASQCGCGSVKFNIIQPSGRGKQLDEQKKLLSIKQLIQLGEKIEKNLQKNYKIPLLFSWPMAFQSIKRLSSGKSGSCNIFNILGILCSGHISMCGIGTQEKDLIYGQLGVDKLADIWADSPKLIDLRTNLPEQLEGICHDCLFKNRCLGTCIAQNYLTQKKVTAPFWFCEQAFSDGLFPGTRLKNNNR